MPSLPLPALQPQQGSAAVPSPPSATHSSEELGKKMKILLAGHC